MCVGGADIINLVTVSLFGYKGRMDDGFTYAQAYWFTVASTIISSITNVTLLIDFIRTKDFAASGSGLSHKQRSLVIIVIILFSWVAIGAGCFTALLGIDFQDSLYFTIVSMESELCSKYMIHCFLVCPQRSVLATLILETSMLMVARTSLSVY